MPVIESASGTGMLLVLMEPPASLEEEFNDWYDTEHFPQRCSLPGFLSGSRWICLDGWPRWAALYPLTSPDALQTPDYLAVSGKNSTPWSRRILPRTIGRMRIVGRVLPEGDPLTRHSPPASGLLISRYPVRPDQCRAALSDIRSGLSHAGAAEVSGIWEEGSADLGNLWAIASFRRPVSAERLRETAGQAAETGATLFNLYRPYNR